MGVDRREGAWEKRAGGARREAESGKQESQGGRNWQKLRKISQQILFYCVVPENIHTPPNRRDWKFQGGGGLEQAKI